LDDNTVSALLLSITTVVNCMCACDTVHSLSLELCEDIKRKDKRLVVARRDPRWVE